MHQVKIPKPGSICLPRHHVWFLCQQSDIFSIHRDRLSSRKSFVPPNCSLNFPLDCWQLWLWGKVSAISGTIGCKTKHSTCKVKRETPGTPSINLPPFLPVKPSELPSLPLLLPDPLLPPAPFSTTGSPSSSTLAWRLKCTSATIRRSLLHLFFIAPVRQFRWRRRIFCIHSIPEDFHLYCRQHPDQNCQYLT